MDYGFVDEANENHKVEVDPRDVGAWGRGQAGLGDTAGKQRWFGNAHLRRSAQNCGTRLVHQPGTHVANLLCKAL